MIDEEGYPDEEKESEELKENMKKVMDLLIHFNKEFEVVYWGDGEGVDIIINESDINSLTYESKKYKQTIGISNAGHMKFEKQEAEDETKNKN